MNNIQLFIENKEVELDKSVQFAITKQFEDLSDPTVIINDWSKTVDIPFTTKNNTLFGNLYRNDRTSVLGDNSTGLYFDASKRLSFRLELNKDILMEGYAKMNSVKKTGDSGLYNISLYGNLGKIFGELQKITVTDTEVDDDKKYYIGDIVQDYINKEIVKKSWTELPNLDTPIESADTTDIIGFACTSQGYNEDFDYKSMQQTLTDSTSFEDITIIEGKTVKDIYDENKISFESVLGNGLTDRGVGQYRSYMQTPFIYVPRMFEILQKKCKEITDYDLILEKSWFTKKNPYYRNAVMMLNQISKNEHTYIDKYYTYFQGGTHHWTIDDVRNSIAYRDLYQFSNRKPPIEEYPNIIGQIGRVSGFLFVDDYNLQLSSTSNFVLKWESNAAKRNVQITDGSIFVIEILGINSAGTSKVLHKTYVHNSRTSLSKTLQVYESEIVVDTLYVDNNTPTTATLPITIDWGANISQIDYPDGVYLQMNSYWQSPGSSADYNSPLRCRDFYNLSVWRYFGYNDTDILNGYYEPSSTLGNDDVTTVNVIISARSNSKFKFEFMWDKERSFLSQILNYTKMFNLMWKTDDINKTVTILPKTTYFSNYTIEKWDDKVDYSKDFEVTPIILDNKYYKFNYEESDSELNTIYKNKYGYNFGELSIKTLYNFNTSTKDLFDGIKTTIPTTEAVLPYSRFILADVTSVNAGEIMISQHDKDKKTISIFGQFCFYNGLTEFNTRGAYSLGAVEITDDTRWQTQTGNYMFHRISSASTIVNTYPLLDVISSQYLMLFNIPNTSFTYGSSDYSTKKSIYRLFWKNMMEGECLNINTNKITCYIKLNILDFKRFEYNRFVTINNQLYIVNKIYDYNFDNASTKCDLIRIDLPSNYYDSELVEDIDYVGLDQALSENIIIYGNSRTNVYIGTVDSITDLTFENGTKTYTSEAGNYILTIKGNDIYYTSDGYGDIQHNVTDIIEIRNKYYTNTITVIRTARVIDVES